MVVPVSLALLVGTTNAALADSAPQQLPADFSATSTTREADIRFPALSQQSLDDLRAKIDEILHSPSIRGHALSASVTALSSGKTIFEHDPRTPLKPASNTKVVTTAAAFDILGSDWRPVSRIVSKNEAKNGILQGPIALQGIEDLSWSNLFYPTNRYPAQQLIRQLEQKGITKIDGDITVYGLFVVDGFHFGTLDTAVERRQVAELFRKALVASPIRFTGHVQISDSAFPGGYAHEQAVWEGPSLGPIVAEINRVSHNEFADMLMLAIARSDGKSATYRHGFDVVNAWMRQQSIFADGVDLHDGSGLSHSNRISAKTLTTLIAYAQKQPWAHDWNTSLSIAGVDGTYRNRMLGDATLGCTWMKSGTINGVISSSGILFHRGTGEAYAISLILNDVYNGPSARIVLDKITTEIATLDANAARPAIPQAQSAVFTRNDQVQLQWRGTPQASSYYIEARTETRGWETIREVQESSSTSTTFPRSAVPTAYRVRASNSSGISDPSGVLIAGGASTAPSVVVIDGNERWTKEPSAQNALHVPNTFLTKYLAPLTGYRVSSMTAEGFNSTVIESKATILYVLGRQADHTRVFTDTDRAWMEAHLAGGGHILVSGAEAAWDLSTRHLAGDAFLDRVFGLKFVDDDAHDTVACLDTSLAAEAKTDATCGHFWSRSQMQIKWPDALQTTDGISCMRYGNGNADACVTKGSAAWVGFPLESIDNRADRSAVIRTLLKMVGTPDRQQRT